MARIRNLKPDFWTDEKLVELDPWERLLFIGLWNFADDEGFLPFSPKRIKMQIFPADSLEISVGLQNLISIGALTLYDCGDDQVLHVTNWAKHQKVSNPTKSKYSEMDLSLVVSKPRKQADPAPQIPEPSLPGTELSREVHKEREREGGRERGLKTPSKPAASKPDPNRFPEFWEWYPRKVGKADAQKAWAKATAKTDPQEILDGLERYRLDPNLPEKEFIPHASTWLAGGRWEDEPLPARNVVQMRPTGAQIRLQAGYDLLQQTQARQAGQLEIGEL